MVDWKTVNLNVSLTKIGSLLLPLPTGYREAATKRVVSFGGAVTSVVPNTANNDVSIIATLRDEAEFDRGFWSRLAQPGAPAPEPVWEAQTLSSDQRMNRTLTGNFDRESATLVLKDSSFRINSLRAGSNSIRSAEIQMSSPGLDFEADPDSPLGTVHYTLEYDHPDDEPVSHRWLYLHWDSGTNRRGVSENPALQAISVWTPSEVSASQYGRQPNAIADQGEVDQLVSLSMAFSAIIAALRRQ